MIAALLFEPVNGRKRRGRLGQALEPAGRPLLAMRAKLGGKAGGESGQGSGATLVDRLQHVAVRAQGKIDLPDGGSPAEPEAGTGDGAVQEAGTLPEAEGPKPRKRRKATGSAE
jgi:hypothetical protein